MLKLNLGCGQNKLAGYVNIDKEGDPDLRIDLEQFPWAPGEFRFATEMRHQRVWLTDTANALPDSCADEVVLNHVLEHLGRDPDVFIGVMKELYRVCAPDARVRIAVPHPRHDHFLGDPTHVRPITDMVLSLFSLANCQHWKAIGASNTPLALYHGVDFEIIEKRINLEPKYRDALADGTYTALQIEEFLRERNNVASELRFVLRVVK